MDFVGSDSGVQNITQNVSTIALYFCQALILAGVVKESLSKFSDFSDHFRFQAPHFLYLLPRVDAKLQGRMQVPCQ